MQAKSETNVQTTPFIECSFAKVPSNQSLSISTVKPFLFDSNFRNRYSLYRKVADLFDTFEGKFIPVTTYGYYLCIWGINAKGCHF